MAQSSASWSITKHLLSLDESTYKAATQSPFLLAAGKGRLSKEKLGTWLANDRLYIHAYLKAIGRTLSVVDLPQTTPGLPSGHTSATDTAAPPETQFVDWLVECLAAMRREERFFVATAEKYGLAIDLPTEAMPEGGREIRRVPGTAKLPGLVMYERLFGTLHPASTVDRALPLAWLEAAVVFWGTERAYSDAWAWARSHLGGGAGGGGEGQGPGGGQDADGGALREAFIPNWANDEFARFVGTMGGILDRAVAESMAVLGEGARAALVERAEKVWKEVLDAEVAFWPQ